MRLWFVAKAKPYMLKRCMGGYRLHGESKTIAQADRFDPEFRQLRAEYRKYLTPGERKLADEVLRDRYLKDFRNKAWAALMGNNVAEARRHAREALRLDCFSLRTWRLMYCAIRGY